MTTKWCRPQCLCRWLDFEKHQNFGVISFSGVFVITHVDTCRGGAGYCILGFTCEIDKDFVADDLGGHCDGLVAAFNPKANFVCCKQNPDLFEDDRSDELEAVILEHNINHPTAVESTSAGIFFRQLYICITYIYYICFKKVGEENEETGQVAEVKPEENIDDNVEMTATNMIDELYTKPTTSVEDITKVMEDFIVV